jgi:GPH family glycoside/pentoside/hexuronide:cation symporter
MKSVVDVLGGDASAWSYTAVLTAVWLVAPWFAVYAVSFERPIDSRSASPSFLEAMRALATHHTYQILMVLYILARVAVDLIGAMLLFYFAYLIGREADFAPTLALFLVIVVLSLPVWLAVAKKHDKRTLFIAGAAWWAVIQVALFFGDSSWPRWILFTVPPLAAIGYAVAEMMPWSMLGDVIDEDELETGERREGMYVGFFTFLRKIGGATAVLLMGLVLELSGFVGGIDRIDQSETALLSIRVMTSLVPMAVLLLAIAAATRYPLTREDHARTISALARRRQEVREATNAGDAAR